MANGDAAAAAGLQVFASTQDVRQGYDNDNIRGDEIAKNMARTKKLEASVQNPTVVQEAAANGGAIDKNGGTLGATGTLAVSAQNYKRVIEIDAGALVTGLGSVADKNLSPYADVILRKISGGTTTEIRSWRTSQGQMSVGGHVSDVLPANASASYQLLWRSSAASAVTGNSSFTYLTLTIPTNGV